MTLLSALLMTSCLAPQGGDPGTPRTSDEVQAARLADDLLGEGFRIPVHPDPAPDATAGHLVAGARDYVANFGAEFELETLHERKRDQGRHYLRWRTLSFGVGTQERRAEGAVPAAPSEWRVEYRHPGWTEAYDVLPEGVEQTFVLPSRPAVPGALRIRGLVESDLSARPRAPAHAPLRFLDASGTPRIDYGSATAIDALGRSSMADNGLLPPQSPTKRFPHGLRPGARLR